PALPACRPGYGAGLPDDLNLARIRHEHAVSGELEPISGSQPIERGFHRDGDWREEFSEQREEMDGIHRQSTGLADQLTGVGERAESAVANVKIESSERHRASREQSRETASRPAPPPFNGQQADLQSYDRISQQVGILA